jgi:hypothetical protein
MPLIPFRIASKDYCLFYLGLHEKLGGEVAICVLLLVKVGGSGAERVFEKF